MENFDNLIISLIDSDAMKGCFMKELGRILDVPVVCISDVWLEHNQNKGVVSTELRVSFIDAEIRKEKLMDLPFKAIYENVIIFEVGDTVL